MSVTDIKNGLLYNFNEFDFLTLPFVGGVFLLECADLFFLVGLLLSLARVGSFCQLHGCGALPAEPLTTPCHSFGGDSR